jgi:glycine dehydrogenase subunit 1
LSDVKGCAVLNEAFFNEFTLRLPRPAAGAVEDLARRGILAGVPVSRLLPEAGLDDLLLVASTEVNTEDDRAAFAATLREVLA